MPTPPKHRLYWGDFHTHFAEPDLADATLRSAKANIDFCTVLCYPFDWDDRNGLKVESTGNRPAFLEAWRQLNEAAASHHEPGRFVTFPGYEWNGDRTRFGDHNVIYAEDGLPLDDAFELPALYANLRDRKALALPHHTGYQRNWRGKDWDYFDPDLSPVMEVFSVHGSSEGCNTPHPMHSNSSMSPRTSGGAFQDALARGLRIGVIGSNDYSGLPGRWGLGRAAVWAADCTREAIFEALLARRTYAVTGDRIELEVSLDGSPMGAEIAAAGPVAVQVKVRGSHAVDRIELLHNGVVLDTYCHSGKWERQPASRGRFKIYIESGWGAAGHYGLEPTDEEWRQRQQVDGGRLLGCEPVFQIMGQEVTSRTERCCEWRLVVPPRTAANPNPFGMRQGVVLEIEGDRETTLRLDAGPVHETATLGDLLEHDQFVPLVDEARDRILAFHELRADEVHNRDSYFHHARKLKLHRAIPEAGYVAEHVFADCPLTPGRNNFYVRASQLNGQLAWSSPIWVDNTAG